MELSSANILSFSRRSSSTAADKSWLFPLVADCKLDLLDFDSKSFNLPVFEEGFEVGVLCAAALVLLLLLLPLDDLLSVMSWLASQSSKNKKKACQTFQDDPVDLTCVCVCVWEITEGFTC